MLGNLHNKNSSGKSIEMNKENETELYFYETVSFSLLFLI